MFSSLAGEIAIGAGAFAAAGLVAGGCAYAAMWPASQIFGQTLIAPSRPGEIALTFDDGPNPAWTPRLLDILAEFDVKATFFLVGRYAESEPVLTRRLAEAGHTIGNHSWSHPNLALCATKRAREELHRTQETLEQIVGRPVKYFRPPFGGRRPAVLRIARELGMTPVMWNAMTTDWAEPSASQIALRLGQRIEKAGRRGRAANVVLHDGSHQCQNANRGPSVQAVEILLERYAGSRKFVTVDGW